MYSTYSQLIISSNLFSKLPSELISWMQDNLSDNKKFVVEDHYYHLDVLPNKLVYSYLDYKDELISFMPISRVESDIKTNFNSSKRQEIKFIRLFNNIANSFSTTIDFIKIQKWYSIFKSNIATKENSIQIIRGDELKKYFLIDNYVTVDKIENSVLHQSCMSYSFCQPFLDFYAKNPQQVGLAVLLDNGKVKARSLVWKSIDNVIFMDRIYYVDEIDIEVFIKYAVVNKWIYKTKQNTQSENIFSDNRTTFNVKLDHVDFKKYPFLDTLSYLNLNTHILSNKGSSTEGIVVLQGLTGNYILPGQSSPASLYKFYDYPDAVMNLHGRRYNARAYKKKWYALFDDITDLSYLFKDKVKALSILNRTIQIEPQTVDISRQSSLKNLIGDNLKTVIDKFQTYLSHNDKSILLPKIELVLSSYPSTPLYNIKLKSKYSVSEYFSMLMKHYLTNVNLNKETIQPIIIFLIEQIDDELTSKTKKIYQEFIKNSIIKGYYKYLIQTIEEIHPIVLFDAVNKYGLRVDIDIILHYLNEVGDPDKLFDTIVYYYKSNGLEIDLSQSPISFDYYFIYKNMYELLSEL